MPAKITLERIIRDDDDQTGRDVREWTITRENEIITIKGRKASLLISTDDVPDLIADMQAMVAINFENSRTNETIHNSMPICPKCQSSKYVMPLNENEFRCDICNVKFHAGQVDNAN